MIFFIFSYQKNYCKFRQAWWFIHSFKITDWPQREEKVNKPRGSDKIKGTKLQGIVTLASLPLHFGIGLEELISSSLKRTPKMPALYESRKAMGNTISQEAKLIIRQLLRELKSVGESWIKVKPSEIPRKTSSEVIEIVD